MKGKFSSIFDGCVTFSYVDAKKLEERVKSLEEKVELLEEINGAVNDSPWVKTEDTVNEFESIFQRIIRKGSNPKGTVEFTTPKGGVLRAFNHEKGILFNINDVSQMLGHDIGNIDFAKDSYKYIPCIGEDIHINADRLLKEMGPINYPYPENYEFVFCYVKPYMENPINFLEEGTKLYLPTVNGIIVGVIESVYRSGVDVTYNFHSGSLWCQIYPADIGTDAFLSHEAATEKENPN